MNLTMMKAKIQRATVTQCDLHYEGSITVDSDLLKASGIPVIEVWDAVGDAIDSAVGMDHSAIGAMQTRHLLAQFNDQQLADIGISHSERMAELERPFWQ